MRPVHLELGLDLGAQCRIGQQPAAARAPGTFPDAGVCQVAVVAAIVDPKATIAQEEIFGPVLAVIPYADEQEAVAIANDSDYGLGGSVWTADPERGASFARKVRSGTIGVNGYVNDPCALFGGIKASGMGRELGPQGLQPFQLLKTIYLDEANDPRLTRQASRQPA
jgi:acyl-CoA reductase-like NAD-dependent aldehyde dehydrogenase